MILRFACWPPALLLEAFIATGFALATEMLFALATVVLLFSISLGPLLAALAVARLIAPLVFALLMVAAIVAALKAQPDAKAVSVSERPP